MNALFSKLVGARTLRGGSLGAVVGAGVLCGGGSAIADPYVRKDLVTNICCGSVQSDPNLLAAWGLAMGASGGPVWVTANMGGRATLYDGAGTPQSLVVRMQTAPGLGISVPSGIVANPGSAFKVTDDAGGIGPAKFLFATQEGTITGWKPIAPPATQNRHASIAVDRSNGAEPGAANYTGLGISTGAGGDFLYAADFANNRIDTFNAEFVPVQAPFRDPGLPAGYAPFNARVINGLVYVAYARQDGDHFKPEPGPGAGAISVFDLQGAFQKRLITGGVLNAPWGMALAPDDFGPLGGLLLIANTGDGRVNAFKLSSGDFVAVLKDDVGPIQIDGLHGIEFGNGSPNQPTNTLFFAASPTYGVVGIFGRVDVSQHAACAGDFNTDGLTTVQDLFDFMAAYFAGGRNADANRSGSITVQDIFDFLAAWFAGCA